MKTRPSLIPAERIQRAIFLVRGEKVMVDSDLAALYGVQTGALNRAIKRNSGRFPADFMFQLTVEEAENLKCQFGISTGWGGRRRSLPYAFTEQGVAMLSSVLHSERAVQVNVAIMRAFVQLRRVLGIRQREVKSPADEQRLQDFIRGVEKKPMPHLLCVTNMLLHQVEVPVNIRHDNTLARPYPRIPLSRQPSLVMQRGEVTSQKIKTFFGQELFLYSAIARPGNSGGPVVAATGHIVGIVTAVHSQEACSWGPFHTGIATAELTSAIAQLDPSILFPVETYE